MLLRAYPPRFSAAAPPEVGGQAVASLADEVRARLGAAVALPQLREPVAATAEDEAAFAEHATTLTADYAVIGSACMTAVILLWWPIDWLVGPDARFVEAFAFMRARGLVIEAATLGLFLGSRRARRASRVVAPGLLAVLLGCVGYSLGRLGGADLSWLADAMVGTIAVALVPIGLGRRVVTTLLVGLALPAGFFLAFPENWRAPGAKGQLSFIVFTMVFAVVLGDVLYRVLRRAFLQQRGLARARAELAELSGSLADRVAAQTGELRALAGHLERVQEEERRRISRDLHDQLAQELTAMRYALALAERRCERDPEAMGVLVADLGALLEGTAAIVRSFISDLRPRVLDDLGLVAAAEWLCARARSSATVELCVAEGFPDVGDSLDPEIALVLFRVLQEATTNALRHAGAGVIALSLGSSGAELTVAVRDDGVGFDPAATSAGFGLLGIRERARAVGGRLVVESSPGRGTRVAVTAPARLGAAPGAAEIAGTTPEGRRYTR